ncbi:MAG: hypothetical protein AAFU59_10415 [Pseudomonadota bacterium]
MKLSPFALLLAPSAAAAHGGTHAAPHGIEVLWIATAAVLTGCAGRAVYRAVKVRS